MPHCKLVKLEELKDLQEDLETIGPFSFRISPPGPIPSATLLRRKIAVIGIEKQANYVVINGEQLVNGDYLASVVFYKLK